MKKFYVASSFKNIQNVKLISEKLKSLDYIQTYDWTELGEVTTLEALKEIGQKEKVAVKEADFLIVLLPAGKGSHIEFGIALGGGIKVFLYSSNNEKLDLKDTSTFYHLPEVTSVNGSIQNLLDAIKNEMP